jgi:tRNA nucleotidyltransferase/poly(A) polymerase
MSEQTNTYYRPWMQDDAITQIFTALDGQARFVGGCVRNMLLDAPINDIDIATPFLPQDVMERLTDAGIKAMPTGLAHGTITAVLNHTGYEITTLRKDVDCNGRHAEVEFTDQWEEDAARRDFTINAMSCDQSGRIYDYFGGMDDIATRAIRFVGDAQARCQEDYLRILRFFRFTAWYGTAMNKEGFEAACQFADHLPQLSGERINQEMKKLLSAPSPLWVLESMSGSPVWNPLFQVPLSLEILHRYYNTEQQHNIAIHPIARLTALVLTSNDANATISSLRTRWRLSNDDTAMLKRLCKSYCTLWSEDTIRESIRTLKATDTIFALALSISPDDVMLAEGIHLARTWHAPDFPLTGRDLLAHGYASGKELGELLKKAENHWIAKQYEPSKDELIAYLGML